MRKVLLTLLGLTVGMMLGPMANRPQIAMNEASAEGVADSKHLDRLIATLERIRTNYVDELDQSELVDAAIKGIMGVLDSHSTYLDQKTFRQMQITIRGVGLVGIEVTMEKGLARVIAPLDDSPAAAAGVKAGDIITHIDDVPLQGLILDQAYEKIRGPVNTKVRLKIMREGEDKPVELSVVRNSLHRIRSVRTRPEAEDVGYIRIAYFNEQATYLVRNVISELESQIPSDRLKGYVLDLRNNPGGLLDQVVSVADAFLEDGEIVSVRGRNPEQIERFNARPGDLVNGKPVIVLINGGSASGAEIVAGALQDHKRATLIGSRSFGKGSVPTIIPLGQGNGALRLTTARYFTPAGRSIQATGIVPDIEVLQNFPDNADNDQALRLAYDLLRGIASHAAFPPNRKAATVPH
jgi:carboxyl-terminal processing protease